MGKVYKPELKEYVCKLVLEEGRKKSQLAYETGVSLSSITRWVDAHKEKLKQEVAEEGLLVTTSELQAEIRELRKDLADKEEENEILKKAMHVFTKSQA